MSNKMLPLAKRRIIELKVHSCDAFSGVAAGWTLNGVPVLVMADSVRSLNKALTAYEGPQVDAKLCQSLVAAKSENFSFSEDEL